MTGGHDWFALNPPFDAQYRLVTSGFLPPFWLFLIRLTFAVYAVTANIINLIWYLDVLHEPLERYYVYFTRLTYIGVTAYFCTSSFHTGFFTLNRRHAGTSQGLWYPLQKWGKFLQAMHLWLYCTAVSFAPLVTIIFWTILQSDTNFATPFNSWVNVTVHIMNAVFMVIELVIGRVPMPWGYLPFVVITLGLYTCFAYLMHSIQGWYVYGFLDPTKGTGRLVAYIVGIAVGGIIGFLIMWAMTKLRDWIFQQGRGVRVTKLSKHGEEKPFLGA